MIKNRWVDEDADDFVARFAGKGIDPDLALRVYTSRLIGSDPDLVMYGGGNTSCKQGSSSGCLTSRNLYINGGRCQKDTVLI